jgi:hypothetical protein
MAKNTLSKAARIAKLYYAAARELDDQLGNPIRIPEQDFRGSQEQAVLYGRVAAILDNHATLSSDPYDRLLGAMILFIKSESVGEEYGTRYSFQTALLNAPPEIEPDSLVSDTEEEEK